MFAGTDTTSLALTWILYLLAYYPDIQDRLRTELLSVVPSAPVESLTADEIQSLYASIVELQFLENVIRETLRLIPPVHSSIRMATKDDVVPVSSPLKRRTLDGRIQEEIVAQIFVPKGTFIHVPIEGFNLDKELWGSTAWNFKYVFARHFQCIMILTIFLRSPDRWTDLPETVKELPGLYNHLLTFSAGPRVSYPFTLSPIG